MVRRRGCASAANAGVQLACSPSPDPLLRGTLVKAR